MNPLISVITPCFNDGRFLDDACQSVASYAPAGIFEHIIVNDGSTDSATIQKLTELEKKGYRVIHQANKGLAAARNEGISVANGKYILPLDCDNKIIPATMLKAAGIMNDQAAVDVVYTDSFYFGDKQGPVPTIAFDLLNILYKNYIDACALIRKDTLLLVGCYDGNMPFMGHEDWELWVKIAVNKGTFYHLPEVGYHYRVVSTSMVRTQTLNRENENRTYIFNKNQSEIADWYARLYEKEASLLQMNKYIKANRWKAAIKLILNRPLTDA